jgi:hypothetical protein
MTNRVNRMAAKLKAAARTPAEAAEWVNQANGMNERILQRARSITDQLAIPEAVPLRFDTNGQAVVRNWRQKIDKEKGSAFLNAASLDGRAVLKVAAGPTGCIASWRARVAAPPGKYQFVASAKAHGVAPRISDIGAGGGIRISGGKRTSRLAGDTDWTRLEYLFEVPPSGEVDLVCELRAEKGEIAFDDDSFRVIRMPAR